MTKIALTLSIQKETFDFCVAYNSVCYNVVYATCCYRDSVVITVVITVVYVV